MPLAGQIAFSLATHAGQLRTNNEDAIAIDPERGLLVLADGMGGYQAGEVASRLAVDSVLERVRSAWQTLDSETDDPEADGGASPALRLLERALLTAHERVHERSHRQEECAGMGTTAVACLLRGRRAWIAHAGDSRAYLWRDGSLRQLTRDHSLLEALIARGVYSREEAQRRVGKNIVTRAIGISDDIEIELMQQELAVGDLILLCSDGLHDMLDDRAINDIISAQHRQLDRASQTLIDAANSNGGYDNISVVLARIDTMF